MEAGPKQPWMMERRIEKQAYRINDFVYAYGICRSKVFEEIKKGRLKIFKLGRSTFISAAEARKWMKLCESESEN